LPDLMLSVVVSRSLLHGSRGSIAWALAGGLLLDLLSGGPFGAITVSLALAAVVTGSEGWNAVRGALWLPGVASVLATAVYDATYLLVLQITGRAVPWVASLLPVIIPSMILNALWVYPTLWAMRWLDQRAGQA